jgi:hypothetical protein
MKIKGITALHALIISLALCITFFLLGIFKITDTWPAMLALLLFFEGKAKMDNLKNIFCGGIAGLLLPIGFLLLIAKCLIPVMGIQLSVLLAVFVFVFLIITLGDLLHIVFNNYTLLYFTVALIVTQQSTVKWLIALVLGGGFLIALVTLVLKLIAKTKTPEKTIENAKV